MTDAIGSYHGDPVHTRFADTADADRLAALINEAFVVERPIFDGDRTNPEQIRNLFGKGRFLVAEDAGRLAGCVYVEVQEDRGYIGLLCVDPSLQGSGLGRRLMEAAEEFFRRAKCVAVDLRVLSPRTPLPSFYRHLGYRETHTSQLPPEVPTKVPCHYIHLAKDLD